LREAHGPLANPDHFASAVLQCWLDQLPLPSERTAADLGRRPARLPARASACRPSGIPSARWLRTFGSFRVGRAAATIMV